MRTELDRLGRAQRVLDTLSTAISQLSAVLKAEERNEAALQHCLTAHPILFGLDYRRVIPKHRLGANFEMDYALERVSGFVDVVEIEASTHRLYTQHGNPSHALVHAEQQVLDWLEWLERHYAYAMVGLPDLVRPRGYVVIGRSLKMTEEQRRRLKRRNKTFGDSLQVLTYDNVLDRARNTQRLLHGCPQKADTG